MTQTILLRLLFFQEGVRWVAQCVDYDICAGGESISDAQVNFSSLLATEVCLNLENNRGMLDGIPPAPAHFEKLFTASQERLEQLPIELPRGEDVPPAHVIRAVAADRRINSYC
jgi:hypothetical protein